MIALTIVILLAVWAGSIESNLMEVFSDPEISQKMKGVMDFYSRFMFL